MLEAYVCGCFVGVVGESIARTARLWLYRQPTYPVTNVLVMFGLIMGALSLAVPTLGHLPVLLIAAAIGYGYEMLNFAILDWWDFPGDRFLVFEGEQACALSVGALWGVVPLIIHHLRVFVF